MCLDFPGLLKAIQGRRILGSRVTVGMIIELEVF